MFCVYQVCFGKLLGHLLKEMESHNHDIALMCFTFQSKCVCVSVNMIIARRWCFPVCGTSRSLNLYFVLGNRAASKARSTAWKRIITCSKQNFWTLQKHQHFTNKRRGNKNPFQAYLGLPCTSKVFGKTNRKLVIPICHSCQQPSNRIETKA